MIGISLKIDVTKIDKDRLYKGKKGTYLDLTTFIDVDNKDQYENNGFITQSLTKEERENKEQLPILGNTRVFYNDSEQQAAPAQQTANAPATGDDGVDDDFPF